MCVCSIGVGGVGVALGVVVLLVVWWGFGCWGVAGGVVGVSVISLVWFAVCVVVLGLQFTVKLY